MMYDGAHVLDVGSGSGYLTACMAMLVTVWFDRHYFYICHMVIQSNCAGLYAPLKANETSLLSFLLLPFLLIYIRSLRLQRVTLCVSCYVSVCCKVQFRNTRFITRLYICVYQSLFLQSLTLLANNFYGANSRYVPHITTPFSAFLKITPAVSVDTVMYFPYSRPVRPSYLALCVGRRVILYIINQF